MIERWAMRAFLLAACVLAWPVYAQAQNVTRVGGQITSATTTTILAGAANSAIQIADMSLCISAAGVQTSLIIQDSTGKNYIGTNAIYVLGPGACLAFPYKGTSGYGIGTSGAGLQVITGAAGPVTYFFEVFK